MKINQNFVDQYLTAGETYDNFIFENCPADFLLMAKDKLSEVKNGVKPCNIVLTKDIEEMVESVLNNCKSELQKKILSRDFVVAMIVEKMLDGEILKKDEYVLACQQINAFNNGDFNQIKDLHIVGFMPYEIKALMREIGKIELNFFLDNTKNKYLQQSINIFVSSREPYSVKIFTTNEKLSSYYDLNGNIIECPHDFMRRDVNMFIEQDEKI